MTRSRLLTPPESWKESTCLVNAVISMGRRNTRFEPTLH
jgi:hypothetical protein